MKRFFIFLFLSFFISYSVGHTVETGLATPPIPEVWTAEKAVAFALDANPESTIALKRIDQALASAAMAHSSDYPLVNFSTEYSQTNNPMYSFGTILNQGAFNESIDFNDPGRTDNLRLKVEASYVLYNGGRDRAEQAAAAAHINVSRADLAAVHQQLAFEVVKTFLAIIQAEKMVAVREEALLSITAALDVGKARFDAGDLLQQDLLNLELQQSRADENLIQSRHRLELTKRGFLNLLGLREGKITLAPNSIPHQEMPNSFDYNNRQELKRLEAIEQGALAEMQKAKGITLPSIDAFAGYQIDSGSVLSENGNSWMAGIRMHYTLFDGKKSTSAITKAQLKLQEIQSMRKKIELALHLEIQQALLDYEQAQKRLTVTEKMVGVATEVIRLSRARFTEGVILASDLIDFEMRLSDAQARQLAAEAGYQMAIANLRRATGLEQFPGKKNR